MTFQKTLNRDIPQAVAGDFASANPRASMLAGEGALRTASPVIVGRFAFAAESNGLVGQTYTVGMRTGFVHRNNQAVVPLGQSASMVIPAGKEVALFTTGDFYTIFAADVVTGAPVYALEADGTPVTVATAAQPTKFIVAKGSTAGTLTKITVLG